MSRRAALEEKAYGRDAGEGGVFEDGPAIVSTWCEREEGPAAPTIFKRIRDCWKPKVKSESETMRELDDIPEELEELEHSWPWMPCVFPKT